MRVVSLCLFAMLSTTVIACGDDDSSTPDDDAMDVTSDTKGDSELDGQGDGANDLVSDGGDDQMGDTSDDTVSDTTGDVSTDQDTSSCVTDRVTLAMAGTTSACSFPVPDTFDQGMVNVVMGGRQLCRRSTRNCAGQQGWFWINGEVGLCDETCIAFTSGLLIAEHGCPTERCTSNCLKAGEFCGNDGLCCLRAECELGTCRACTPAGESCSGDSQCCEGSSCVDGMCLGQYDAQCTDSIGCTEGECLTYTCRCPTGDHHCGGECLPNDELNCGGCGNACDADEACVLNQCQCDPEGPTPDSCGGECVNTENNPQHCGFCNRQCLANNTSCIAGACACSPGFTDCSGNCVDVDTNTAHCGTCNNSCSPSSEDCVAGACVCAVGYTDCSGTCRDLNNDPFNCGMCGNACNGNRICTGGSCVMP